MPMHPDAAPHRPYLVRLGADRWVVRGGSPGPNDEPLLRAFSAIVNCLRRRPEAEDGRRGGRLAPRGRRRLEASSACR